GRDHRVDQILRQFVERDFVVVPDAAPANFLAIAVEKGYREIGFLQPVVGGFLEGRTGEGEGQQAEADSEGERLAGEFVEDVPPARKMESVHEGRKGGVIFPRAFPARMQRGIDKRIKSKKSPRDFPAKTRRSHIIEQNCSSNTSRHMGCRKLCQIKASSIARETCSCADSGSA